ncbi:MAG: hypothetical protein ABR543_13435 [Gemmatimonadaceae bacterium]
MVSRPDSTISATTFRSFGYLPGVNKYRVWTTATVQLTSDTQAVRVPLESEVFYTITVAPTGEGFGLSGVVDSFTVSRGVQIPNPSRTPHERIGFTAFLASDGRVSSVRFFVSDGADSGTDSTCNPLTGQMLESVHALFIPLPVAALSAANRWQDTISTTTCIQRARIIATTVRAHEVTAGTDSAVTVAHQGATIFSSAESNAGSTILVTGNGTSNTRAVLNIALGVADTVWTRSTSTLSVAVPQGTATFVQEVSRRAERLAIRD